MELQGMQKHKNEQKVVITTTNSHTAGRSMRPNYTWLQLQDIEENVSSDKASRENNRQN